MVRHDVIRQRGLGSSRSMLYGDNQLSIFRDPKARVTEERLVGEAMVQRRLLKQRGHVWQALYSPGSRL